MPVNNALLQTRNALLRLAQLFDEWLQRLSRGRTERGVGSVLDKSGSFRSSRFPLLHDYSELGQVSNQRIYQHRPLGTRSSRDR